MLARVISEEAATQHSFSAMYAELVMYLICDLGDHSEGSGWLLREGVLEHCSQLARTASGAAPLDTPTAAGTDGQDGFAECGVAGEAGDAGPAPIGTSEIIGDEAVIAATVGSECLAGEEVGEEAEARRNLVKKRRMGAIRFVGELVIREVFESSALFELAGYLLERPLEPERLEGLAALLTVTGPFLDTPAWPGHQDLLPVLWAVHGLSFDPQVPKRVRCLMRNMVELREACWSTSPGKQDERPRTLDEVRHGGFDAQAMSGAFGGDDGTSPDAANGMMVVGGFTTVADGGDCDQEQQFAVWQLADASPATSMCGVETAGYTYTATDGSTWALACPNEPLVLYTSGAPLSPEDCQ